MRVIAGDFKGRTLEAPTWEGLRPTSDRLRETLFNVVAPTIRGARVLDGYAGTGAVGIEALSRGASEVVFVERDRRAVALIEANLARCGVRDRHAIIRSDLAAATGMARVAPFDLVFLDPPYRQEMIPKALQSLKDGGWLKDKALIVAESDASEAFDTPGFALLDERDYGETRLRFLTPA